MRVLIVTAIALLSFACGSSPANNTNKPANVTNTANTNVTSTTMAANNSSSTSNSMTSNSASNMSSNSAANKSNTAVKSNSTTSTTSANSSSTAGQIKGNKATKVYHLPGCPDYNSISPGNVVTFATEQDARKAGYKIAGNCK